MLVRPLRAGLSQAPAFDGARAARAGVAQLRQFLRRILVRPVPAQVHAHQARPSES